MVATAQPVSCEKKAGTAAERSKRVDLHHTRFQLGPGERVAGALGILQRRQNIVGRPTTSNSQHRRQLHIFQLPLMALDPSVPMSVPREINPPSHRGVPQPTAAPISSPQMAVSPPSKRELASWWKKFRKNNDKSDEKGEQAHTVIQADAVHTLLECTRTSFYGVS